MGGSAPRAPRDPRQPAGLCDRCRHQQIVRTGRGSEFSLCLRHKTDERFPKYPRIPVARCSGFQSGDGPSGAG